MVPLKIIGEPCKWKSALEEKMLSLHPNGIVSLKKFYVYK